MHRGTTGSRGRRRAGAIGGRQHAARRGNTPRRGARSSATRAGRWTTATHSSRFYRLTKRRRDSNTSWRLRASRSSRLALHLKTVRVRPSFPGMPRVLAGDVQNKRMAHNKLRDSSTPNNNICVH
ncbi:hypothetical protein E2C01_017136 [Portunus trituberculatus]|uniref:Uncharacterized protein n=1 Tax=Portunus trituberculatus TaxID=210409 RepID=A0A5B7DSK4_PORTR|nr:hypothetical protein [Portunus trituberculatus]